MITIKMWEVASKSKYVRTFVFAFLMVLIVGCAQQNKGKIPTKQKLQQNPSITKNELADHIKYLASDDLGGRYPGTAESQLAQDYIIDQYESAYIAPPQNGYLQSFDFINDIILGANNSLAVDSVSFALSNDFIPLGFSENATLDASVVFVGYGFAIDDSIQWNDYGDVDVKGKWALIFRGGPDEDNNNSPYKAHLPLRKKVLLAQDNQAAGVLFVSQDSDDLIPLKFDNSFTGASIPVLHIARSVAIKILSDSAAGLSTLQDSLKISLRSLSFELKNIMVSATVELEKTSAEAANIIAIIPGNDPQLKDEFIVIGAHYDHLGMGGPGSGSRTPDTLAVHNGADDNASGTAAVLEIGEQLKSIQPKLARSVVLINFDAEERGLLGSKYFVNNPLIDRNNIVAMLNLDMIGQLREQSLTIGGTGTSPGFEDLLSEINQKYNFELNFSPEGYGPSDHASFYSKDIPVLFFFTGTHDDYHKPTDDYQLISLDDEKTISDFVFDIALRINLAQDRPPYTEAGPKESQSSSKNFKVTLGIVPAFGGKDIGLGIDGVKKGGPADVGGILKGDIIIGIDGKGIKNIYDYMYRLGELKKGQIITVTILRDEETLDLTVEL